jgi:hypothetical protein
MKKILPIFILAFLLLPRLSFASNTLDFATTGASEDALGYSAGVGVKAAQSFQVGSSFVPNSITYRLYKDGSPSDNLVVKLYTDSSGSPSSTLLETSSTVAGSSVTTSQANYTFTFTNAQILSANTTYWAVIERTGGNSTSAYYIIISSNSNPYAGGLMKHFTGSWQTYTNQDLRGNLVWSQPAVAPTVDIKCNGQDSCDIPWGTSATLSWTSTDATSCAVTPGDYTGTTGSQSTGNLTEATDYNLSCTGDGGSDTDSVTVTVGEPPTVIFTSTVDSGGTTSYAMTESAWAILNELFRQTALYFALLLFFIGFVIYYLMLSK